MASQPDHNIIPGRSLVVSPATALAGIVCHPAYISPASAFQTPPYTLLADPDDVLSGYWSYESVTGKSSSTKVHYEGDYADQNGNVIHLSTASQHKLRSNSGCSIASSHGGGMDCSDWDKGCDESDGKSVGVTKAAPTERGEAGGDIAANKKRKAGSSRGVANLTAAQLARKRANDREAQRAIRRRTKEQIEKLESKVKELSAQQPIQELTRALSERDAALAENEEIKKRLANVMVIVQPIMDVFGLTEQQLSTAPLTIIYNPNSDNQLSLIAPTTVPYTATSSGQLIVTASPQQNLQLAPSMLPMAKPLDVTAISNHQPPQLAPMTTPLAATIATPTIASMALNSPFTSSASQTHSYATPSPPTSITNTCSPSWADLPPQQMWSIEELIKDKRRMLSQTLEFSDNGEKLGFNFLLGDGRVGPAHQSFPLELRQQQPNSIRDMTLRGGPTSRQVSKSVEFMHPDSVVVSNVPPTCPMDGILLDFLSSRRRKAAQGASSGQLVGPPYPSVSSLLNPSVESYSHPISKVFTEILSTFPHLDALPDRVAVLYIMFLLMRWQIYPTKENYERLPDWLIPLPCQFTTPHPAWMDYLIFPQMRERMVMTNTEYNFADWFIPYTADLSVNWPYEPTDALLATVGCDELMINPVFEQHLRNLDNWSLGPRFTQAFPHLADAAKIRHT
ncbi:hypothetical protein KEM54_000424 [Ascosphaera aggregata]|nr:hypothetical protein KEM54_000424 [Ascosphaera aggregata]